MLCVCVCVDWQLLSALVAKLAPGVPPAVHPASNIVVEYKLQTPAPKSRAAEVNNLPLSFVYLRAMGQLFSHSLFFYPSPNQE